MELIVELYAVFLLIMGGCILAIYLMDAKSKSNPVRKAESEDFSKRKDEENAIYHAFLNKPPEEAQRIADGIYLEQWARELEIQRIREDYYHLPHARSDKEIQEARRKADEYNQRDKASPK